MWWGQTLPPSKLKGTVIRRDADSAERRSGSRPSARGQGLPPCNAGACAAAAGPGRAAPPVGHGRNNRQAGYAAGSGGGCGGGPGAFEASGYVGGGNGGSMLAGSPRVHRPAPAGNPPGPGTIKRLVRDASVPQLRRPGCGATPGMGRSRSLGSKPSSAPAPQLQRLPPAAPVTQGAAAHPQQAQPVAAKPPRPSSTPAPNHRSVAAAAPPGHGKGTGRQRPNRASPGAGAASGHVASATSVLARMAPAPRVGAPAPRQQESLGSHKGRSPGPRGKEGRSPGSVGRSPGSARRPPKPQPARFGVVKTQSEPAYNASLRPHCPPLSLEAEEEEVEEDVGIDAACEREELPGPAALPARVPSRESARPMPQTMRPAPQGDFSATSASLLPPMHRLILFGGESPEQSRRGDAGAGPRDDAKATTLKPAIGATTLKPAVGSRMREAADESRTGSSASTPRSARACSAASDASPRSQQATESTSSRSSQTRDSSPRSPSDGPTGATEVGGDLLSAVEQSPPTRGAPREEPVKQQLRAVFKLFAEEGELYVDCLPEAVALLGMPRPKDDWVQYALTKACNGRSHLDFPDFEGFVAAFRAHFRESLWAICKGDDREAGCPGGAEKACVLSDVSQILYRAGTPCLPGAALEALTQVRMQPSVGSRQPDPARSLCVAGIPCAQEEVDFDALCRIRHIVARRAGFCRTEYDELVKIFGRHDAAGTGLLGLAQVQVVLTSIGNLPGAEATAEALLEEEVRKMPRQLRLTIADDPTKPCFEWDSFLDCVRSLRERELERVRKQFTTSRHGSVRALLEGLGFAWPSPHAVKEALAASGLTDKSTFSLEDVYAVVQHFGAVDGLSQKEAAQVKKVFERCDTDASGDLCCMEIRPALAWLGCSPDAPRLLQIIEDFDIDSSGKLDRKEFSRLVAKFHEDEVLRARKAFSTIDLQDRGALPESELPRLLQASGHDPSPKDLAMLSAQLRAGGHGAAGLSPSRRELDVQRYLLLESGYRETLRARRLQNEGFGDAEVERHRGEFESLDPGGTGFVEKGHLAQLLTELFPGAESSIEIHSKAKDFLQEMDQDSNGKIDFGEYLHMMRVYGDRVVGEKALSQKQQLDAIGVPRQEVRQLREMFDMFDRDRSNALSFGEMRALLSEVLNLKKAELKELQAFFDEVDADGNRLIEFEEFVKLVLKLQNMNWNDINGAAKAIVEGEKSNQSPGVREAPEAGGSGSTTPAVQNTPVAINGVASPSMGAGAALPAMALMRSMCGVTGSLLLSQNLAATATAGCRPTGEKTVSSLLGSGSLAQVRVLFETLAAVRSTTWVEQR